MAKSTWADIGHGGIGDDAGTDESSSYYAGPVSYRVTVSAFGSFVFSDFRIFRQVCVGCVKSILLVNPPGDG